MLFFYLLKSVELCIVCLTLIGLFIFPFHGLIYKRVTVLLTRATFNQTQTIMIRARNYVNEFKNNKLISSYLYQAEG